MTKRPLRIALIGWGAISRRMAQFLSERVPGKVAIVAIGVKNPAADLPPGAVALTSPDMLAKLGLDLVVEAAGREAVGIWAEAALRNAGALADQRLLRYHAARPAHRGRRGGRQSSRRAARRARRHRRHRRRLRVAATRGCPSHRQAASAWRGTAAESLVALDGLSKPTTIFSGSARETAARFPQNANVAVVTALAGIGLDRTRVELVADPGATGNSHRLSVRGDLGKLDIAVETARSRPIRNPRK